MFVSGFMYSYRDLITSRNEIDKNLFDINEFLT